MTTPSAQPADLRRPRRASSDGESSLRDGSSVAAGLAAGRVAPGATVASVAGAEAAVGPSGAEGVADRIAARSAGSSEAPFPPGETMSQATTATTMTLSHRQREPRRPPGVARRSARRKRGTERRTAGLSRRRQSRREHPPETPADPRRQRGDPAQPRGIARRPGCRRRDPARPVAGRSGRRRQGTPPRRRDCRKRGAARPAPGCSAPLLPRCGAPARYPGRPTAPQSTRGAATRDGTRSIPPTTPPTSKRGTLRRGLEFQGRATRRG